MFDWFTSDEQENHDERVFAQARQLESLGYTDIHADHTSKYPDPQEQNDRIVDVRADRPFGSGEVNIEIDSGTQTSRQEREQLEDITTGLETEDSFVHIDGDDPLFDGL